MTTVVAINPLGPSTTSLDTKVDKREEQRRRILKYLASFGVLAVVGVAGYVIGSSQSSAQQAASNAGVPSVQQSQQSDAARSTLQAALEGGNQVLQSLGPVDLEQAVLMYEANPAEWEDNFLSKEIMQALATIRAEESRQSTLRANSVSTSGFGGLPSETQTTVNDVWEILEGESYNGALTIGSDAIVVRKVGTTCRVLAQESNELGDWWSNLKVGSSDILALKQTTFPQESCGCAKKTLWWCSTFKSCPGYRVIGKGYKGFTDASNGIRLALWNRVQSTCAGSDRYLLAGYSRGAAIVANFAAMIVADNLVPLSKMSMVTFGSPRSLDDATSDMIHDKFQQVRIINKQDIVPSIPYDWWGFKHFGAISCVGCSYPEERDRPFAAFSIPDHTAYCKVFGDKNCA